MGLFCAIKLNLFHLISTYFGSEFNISSKNVWIMFEIFFFTVLSFKFSLFNA